MEAQIAVAKIAKYATAESGDSLEMTERPGGGLSFVLADGQSSGKAAKAIANVVTRKAISLLAEGVRDGAAARAASDYLYTYRAGKVQATLNILSIDLVSRTLVISRNNPAPVLLIQNGTVVALEKPSDPVGARREVRPNITEVSLEEGLAAVVYTDGLVHAGERVGRPMDALERVRALLQAGPPDPARWAEDLLAAAVALDQDRPCDDISILVAAIQATQQDDVRRLTVRMPL
jgi:serine phosphatase RsbU (regulator of sigma subunit)